MRGLTHDFLPVGDHLLVAVTHVGHDSVSAAVLLRLWLHGRDEPAANRQWTANRRAVASVKTVEYGVKYNLPSSCQRPIGELVSIVKIQTLFRPRFSSANKGRKS